MTTIDTTVELPANRGGLVMLGELDANARLTFMNGQCHSFAVALHEHTGWPIIGVAWSEMWGDFGHFVCYDEDNDRYVDITGAHTEEEIISRWGCYRPTTLQKIRSWVNNSHYYALHVQEAGTFVQPILDEIREA